MHPSDEKQIQDLARLLARSIHLAKFNQLKPMRDVVPEPDPAMLRGRATCPHCGMTGQVRKWFGIRNMGTGVLRPQSWCRDCRKDPNRKEAIQHARRR